MTQQEKMLNSLTENQILELHAIVDSLEDKAMLHTCEASLYRSWEERIISGEVTLKQARQMLKAAR